ncbi:signal peptidase II [Desulfonema ishimotonii]|uniref:Lipoprotein signal peptidase n=1 Tax=Desulfonema ishimotonii TaxID=45657 RepID=A0A401FUV4_9BACT|nr:signal peptidase II [Desulfonema ishimotonii]GBC60724.1 signal peptidase II [Desulfonema ishimotonii]
MENPTGSGIDKKKYIRLLLIAGVVILLDQITKYIILTTMPLYDSVPVISGLFNITHIHNPGGAFGFFANQSPLIRKAVFLVMSSVAVCVVVYFYHITPRSHPWLSGGLALIFGGAIGNLIDRFRFGKVIDFLDFHIGTAHWPAFNVADSAITIGVTIFVIHLMFNRMPE